MHATQIFMHQGSGKIKKEILLIQSPHGDKINKAEQHVYASSVIMASYVHSIDSEENYTGLFGNFVSFTREAERGRVDKGAENPIHELFFHDSNLRTTEYSQLST